ncbi:MAG: sugar-binding protein [Tepidisphaerales bacterium]
MPSIPKTLLILLAIASTASWPSLAFAGQNMIGRQSQNEGITAVPAPAKVTIDGDLSEWGWSGRIWVFADSGVRNRYSVEVAAMWDADNLYLAAKWKDPTPMLSTVDPDFNPTEGWKADAIQMRVQTDQTMWLTTWYYTPKKMPVLHLSVWKNPARDTDGQNITLLRAKEGGTDLGQGAEMAYKADADGKGYVQEIKIPWKLLYKQVPAMKAGVTFHMGLEFLWGDITGNTWPVHRYADNMQPGQTSREFFWTATKAWGNVELSSTGHLPVRQYVDDTGRVEGTMPIRLVVPRKAARFTAVVEDAAGGRVRNLAADLAPEDYVVADTAETRTIELKWDGLDDKGKLVAPGSYRVRGLTHEGLSAEYDLSFYNPGTPPWPTQRGNGAWGADHAAPCCVAAAGDWMIVSWAFAEGGSGIIGVAPDGLKKWGEKRGASFLAADAEYVYAIPAGWAIKDEVLSRFSATNGAYKPFVLDGKPRPFELPLADIFAGKAPGKAVGLAAGKGVLALAMSEGKVTILDAASTALKRTIDLPGVSAIAFAPDGKLYAVAAGKLAIVDTTAGTFSTVESPGLGKAGAIAADLDGNVVVADIGPDSQVKAYSRNGQLIYTAGRKGGRPIRGAFDAQAMMRMSSVAVDAKGQIWVTESWNFPRRVSIWDRDGKLVRDYIGNTGYAGTGCTLHDTDPTLGYIGPVEVKLDHAAKIWSVTQILWVPDPAAGETFGIDTASHVIPQRFSSSASGKAHEYFYAHDPRDGGGHVIYMEVAGKWRPVAAVCYGWHLSGKVSHDGNVVAAPSGEFADIGAYDIVFWNDANGDGKPQRAECEVALAATKGKGVSLANGWGGRIGTDMVFYTDGLVEYKPIRFTPEGAPVYGPAGMRRMNLNEQGDLVPVGEEDLLLCLSFKGYAGPTTGLLGIDRKTDAIKWAYPNLYPGVHGSHNAPMPRPGLLVGPLKICGIAEVNKQVGRVALLRGNLGQDFLFTTDGLYIGAMFQDGRLPGDDLPDTEAKLKGMPMETFSNGSEAFNGWFGKQADGKIRTLVGFPRQAAMSLLVNGLETVQRFDGPTLSITTQQLEQTEKDNAARTAKAAKAAAGLIARMPAAPNPGDDAAWAKVHAMKIEKLPNRGTAKLACDANNLYVLFDVTDPTPWRNEGKDATRLFKTGDAVDIQLGHGGKRTKVEAGDLRIVIAPLNGKPAAVLMRPLDPAAGKDQRVVYHSPVGDKVFDRVEVLANAQVTVKTTGQGYRVEAAIPLATLGLKLPSGATLRGDVGIIFSDAAGTANASRAYWSNPNTNLVSDLPQEAWIYPEAWAEMNVE